MASDTLIAINRFITPLPLASVWILSRYFLAQSLIVLHTSGATVQAGSTREPDPVATAA